MLFLLLLSCNSDDDGGKVRPVITSFSGTILYDPSMEPVTNGVLFIGGRKSGLFGGTAVEGAIVNIDDGNFDVTIESIEEVSRFGMAIDILQDEFIINTFVAGSDPPLKCLPGDCDRFLPGQNYELIILVPCDPDDCVQFPPPN